MIFCDCDLLHCLCLFLVENPFLIKEIYYKAQLLPLYTFNNSTSRYMVHICESSYNNGFHLFTHSLLSQMQFDETIEQLKRGTPLDEIQPINRMKNPTAPPIPKLNCAPNMACPV